MNNKTYLNSSSVSKTMINKNIFMFLLVFTMLITFSSALEGYGTKQVNEQFTFCQVCQDATYITLSSIETPNSTIGIYANMSSMGGGEYCYNYTPTQIGRYDFRGISDGCEKSFATYVDVTANGSESNIQTSIIQVLIILFFVGLGLGFYYIKNNLDFEKWNNKIYNTYESKNYIKLVFASIGYNIMKHSSVVYFLIGLPILTTLTDLTRIYNLTDLVSIFSTLVIIYTVGIVLVAIYFFGQVQEWLVDLLNKVRDMDWGIEQ